MKGKAVLGYTGNLSKAVEVLTSVIAAKLESKEISVSLSIECSKPETGEPAYEVLTKIGAKLNLELNPKLPRPL